jgi:hypothetical protein
VIVSVQQGEPRDMTSWRLRDDRTAFDADVLDIRSEKADRWLTRS